MPIHETAKRRAALRFAVACVAFAASLLAFAIIVAAGLFLAVIVQSGERGAGVLIALGALVAFGAAVFLVFAPHGYFAVRGRRPAGLIATFVACAPTTLIAFGSLSFAGLPFEQPGFLMDWWIFAGGAVFAFGSAAILLLGYLRLTETPAAPRRPPDWDGDNARVRRA
jgi:hypothetical protein